MVVRFWLCGNELFARSPCPKNKQQTTRKPRVDFQPLPRRTTNKKQQTRNNKQQITNNKQQTTKKKS
ncbi:MAG TPA: hypothetical protein DEA78_02715 [Cyanobacteria bacterium UBA11159]|nr:hypothetical protein [Cyanobacteria bacterium UBA11366]HBR72642.1 hypothetical protein [Cyanobacteria bacterium UBA11159]HCA98142.1 hypothetical protein [Cyanobacteria bacterium UBA9226]